MSLEEVNLKTNQSIIIFGDSITAFGVIRGLRDLNTDIYVVSEKGLGIGLKSKYVKQVFLIDSTLENYCEEVIHLIKNNFDSKPLLMIAGNDDALVKLSKKHDEISKYATLSFPRWDIVHKVINKEVVNEIAKELGIPVIDTVRISSEKDLDNYLESDNSLRYPVFLKSSNSRQFYGKYKTKGAICESEVEVTEAYKKYDGFMNSLLLQEFLPGDIDEIVAVLLVLNKNGEVVSYLANEKVRAATLYGSTTLSRTFWDEELIGGAIKLAEKLKYTGFIGVQFKFDHRSNEFKFLEINGRFSVSVSLAQKCNKNMPQMVYKEFTKNESLERVSGIEKDYKNNVILWWPLSDLAVLTQKRFYMNPLKFITPLIGKGYMIEPFSIRDPKPAFTMFIQNFKTLIKKFKSKSN